jgi:hypothetical protein
MNDQDQRDPRDPYFDRDLSRDPRDPNYDRARTGVVDPALPPQIEEPAPLPVYKADEATTARAAVLLSIINATANLPKLKPLQDEAMTELEVLGEESRVRRLKWNEDNAKRNAEIERRKVALADQHRAKAEDDERKRNEARIKSEEDARQRALHPQLQGGPNETDRYAGDRHIPRTEAESKVFSDEREAEAQREAVDRRAVPVNPTQGPRYNSDGTLVVPQP